VNRPNKANNAEKIHKCAKVVGSFDVVKLKNNYIITNKPRATFKNTKNIKNFRNSPIEKV
jgi:uncharacterized protein (DUF1919 family)